MPAAMISVCSHGSCMSQGSAALLSDLEENRFRETQGEDSRVLIDFQQVLTEGRF